MPLKWTRKNKNFHEKISICLQNTPSTEYWKNVNYYRFTKIPLKMTRKNDNIHEKITLCLQNTPPTKYLKNVDLLSFHGNTLKKHAQIMKKSQRKV